jgi:hypothetical protein
VNEKRGGGGSHRWLFLLIPATLIMVKGMHRRRTMSGQGRGQGSWGHGLSGHHAWNGAIGPKGDATSEYWLPPKIESILRTWHDRAHQTADSAESRIA